MNIYKFEFKSYLKENVIWITALLAVLLLYMALFPALSSEALEFEKLLTNFPEVFLRAFGLNTFSFSNINSYYSFIFTYIVIIGAVFAMKLGVGIISKEFRNKTSDFLLAKPVTRSQVIIPKVFAAFTHIVIMNIVYFLLASLILSFFSSKTVNFTIASLISLSMFFIQIFFLCFGVLLATLLKKLKSVLPLTMGIVFGFYIIQILNQTLEDEKLSYISPFGQFDPKYIIESASYSSSHLVTAIMLSVIFLVVAFNVYRKKDIPST